MVGSLFPEPQSKLITDPRRLRTFSFFIANLLVPRTFSYDVAYPEVAQQGFTFTTAIRSAQPTLPRTILQGPPLPLELLAITSHAFSFSTYTQRARTVGYHAKPPTNPNAASLNRGNTQESVATTSSPSTSSPAQSTEHYRRIERYCLAPYPKDLVPIQNAELRQEVFRKSRLNGTTASPNLSPPYYHTALEKKGDELTRLIADEVAIYWCLQFHQDYVTAATLLNSHNYHPVSSLVRNTHWTALSWQFAIHQGKQEDKKTTEDQSRLADNFEAYIYALYLDQGIETVYKFLCPIYVKKLYSQAKWLKIPLPTKKTVVDVADDGTPYVPSFTEKIKESVLSLVSPKWKQEPRIRRVDYEGLWIPDWQVPCTNGSECKREDCYFDHTGEAYARPSRAEIVPQQSAKQSFHDHASTGIEADVAEAVSRVLDVNSQRFDNGLTSSALSSGDGPQVVRYETGLIKRLDALQRSAMDRFQKDQNLFMERKIKKRINELWGDHKDSQKVLISEVFNHFNQDKKDGLYPRIKRMVDAKVEAVMNKDAERQSQNLRNALDEFETRLTRLEATLSVLQHDVQSAVTEDKLEEIGNRIAALEATMQDSLQHTSNPEATSTPPSVTKPSNVETGPGKPAYNMEKSPHQSSIDLPSTQSPIPAKADAASKSKEMPPSSSQYPTEKNIPSNGARASSSMFS